MTTTFGLRAAALCSCCHRRAPPSRRASRKVLTTARLSPFTSLDPQRAFEQTSTDVLQ